MIVVADVFSNGSASLADVVQAPRDRQMLADFEVALRQSAAFVPASFDRRPDTMRVVFTVQKVDVRERSFLDPFATRNYNHSPEHVFKRELSPSLDIAID